LSSTMNPLICSMFYYALTHAHPSFLLI